MKVPGDWFRTVRPKKWKKFVSRTFVKKGKCYAIFFFGKNNSDRFCQRWAGIWIFQLKLISPLPCEVPNFLPPPRFQDTNPHNHCGLNSFKSKKKKKKKQLNHSTPSSTHQNNSQSCSRMSYTWLHLQHASIIMDWFQAPPLHIFCTSTCSA